MKALRKEPSRRYRSAAELAQDLAAQGDGRPILAHGNSRLEKILARFGKQRLWLGLALGTILLWVSGTVTVHARAIVYGLAGLAMLSLWYALSDRKLGQWIAQGRLMWKGFAVWTTLIIAGSILFPVFLLHSVTARSYLLSNQGAVDRGFAVLFIAMAMIQAGLLGRWVFRQR